MPATGTRPVPPRRAPKPFPYETAGDVLAWFDSIPANRVRIHPEVGRATKRDLLRVIRETGRRYELVDGTLLENTMGSPESFLAMEVGRHLTRYLDGNDLGFLYGADALIELLPKLVRGPDCSFVPWSKRPDKTVPGEPISTLVPALVVEVLSPGNTRGEIARKLREYFQAGVRLVWVIDPRRSLAAVHTAPDVKTDVPVDGALDGGEVLPGFSLPLAKLFERLEKPARPKPKRKR